MADHPATRPTSVKNRPRLRNGFTLAELLCVLFVIAALAALLLPAVRSIGPAGRRMECKSNLRQIGIALHNYHEIYDAFPPAYTVDANGNRLHSWRTLILPFLEHDALYKKIDLSKPWDDPANAEAFQTDIHTYNCPSNAGPTNHTTYMAIVGTDGCIHPTRGRRLDEISDIGETLILIEVPSRQAVHWMEPRDTDEDWVLGFGSDSELPHPEGTHAAFADGGVRFLPADTPVAERRALISISGNDK